MKLNQILETCRAIYFSKPVRKQLCLLCLQAEGEGMLPYILGEDLTLHYFLMLSVVTSQGSLLPADSFLSSHFPLSFPLRIPWLQG